jgi:cytoskeleton protein RodZ
MSLNQSQTHLTSQGYALMLRQAREAKGIPIDFLANVLRVPVDRLQALEEDRLQDLPDLIFARALAQSMCRQLKIDSVPVLATMPDPDPKRSVRITAATGAPLSGMNTASHDIKKWGIMTATALVLLALWAMLGTHLFDDQRPSTSVQSSGLDAESVPNLLPPDSETNTTGSAISTTPSVNDASPSNPVPGPKP